VIVDLETTHSSTLRDYLAVLNRRKWLLIGALLLTLAAALWRSYGQTPLFQSSASLIYLRPTAVTNSLASAPYMSAYDIDRELKTQANVISGAALRKAVAATLGIDESGLNAAVSAQAGTDANVVTITAVSSSADTAARVANAYAQTFVEQQMKAAKDQISSAIDAVVLKLKDFTTKAERANDPGTYGALTQTLSNLRVAWAQATGNYKVAEDAAVASAPFTPRHRRDGIIGLGLGVVFGLAAVFLAEQLDVRVREQREISERLRLPVIGRLPQLSKTILRGHELAVLADPGGGSAEAFRMLRGNLDFLGVDANIKSILVTSCEQSEGKTSTVCNLAVTLARAGKKVVVVEADMRRPKVNAYFGLSGDSGLSSVVSGQTSAAEALQTITFDLPGVQTGGNGDSPQVQHVGVRQVSVLTSGPLPPNPGEIVTSTRIKTLIDEFAAQFDYVLVDSPPFLAVGDAAALATKVDGVIIIMKMGEVTKAMLRDTAEFLEPLPCRKLGVVVTNISTEGGPYSYHYYREYGAKRTPAAVK
jgi:Mrp family chromosome partitioning ATPase/capsular polysaccharide biosynthesis protein